MMPTARGGGGGAAAFERRLGDLEAVAGLADAGGPPGTWTSVEEEGGRVGSVEAELFGDDLPLESGRVAVDDEGGHALVARAGVGLGEDEDVVGEAAVRDPELGAVEHPVVAVRCGRSARRPRDRSRRWARRGRRRRPSSRRTCSAGNAARCSSVPKTWTAVLTSESCTVSAAVKTLGLAPPIASQMRT